MSTPDAAVSNALNSLTAPDATDLARLHDTLAERSDAQGVLDVAYTTIDSPVGPLLLAATQAGLVRVAYQREGFETVLDTISRRVSPRILKAPRRLDGAARELDEYFSGRRTRFDLDLDFALSGGFRELVQRQLSRIDYGRTESYKQVAEQVGNPRAVRAVGTACATNPLPVVVPCHRVLRSDGGLGGYIGGLDAKNTLLTLENAA